MQYIQVGNWPNNCIQVQIGTCVTTKANKEKFQKDINQTQVSHPGRRVNWNQEWLTLKDTIIKMNIMRG
jgi:hypothetical protein